MISDERPRVADDTDTLSIILLAQSARLIRPLARRVWRHVFNTLFQTEKRDFYSLLSPNCLFLCDSAPLKMVIVITSPLFFFHFLRERAHISVEIVLLKPEVVPRLERFSLLASESCFKKEVTAAKGHFEPPGKTIRLERRCDAAPPVSNADHKTSLRRLPPACCSTPSDTFFCAR